MLEVIYRIYEIPTADKKEEIAKMWEDGTAYRNYDDLNKVEITMDILICESREQFKEAIKSMYQGVSFARPRKPVGGEIYCVIIGEHAYKESIQRIFNRTEFTCDFCGKTVRGFINDPTKLSNSEIKYNLLGQEDKYANLNFCSYRCQSRFVDQERATFTDDQNAQGLFITKDSFSNTQAGYIYKITKKSTGEFYVGQTIYVPVFRWGQHLKTGRFKISEIVDYLFEVLEIVPKGVNILDREAFYIQTLYQQSPHLSLNETNVKNIKGLQIKMDAVEAVGE